MARPLLVAAAVVATALGAAAHSAAAAPSPSVDVGKTVLFPGRVVAAGCLRSVRPDVRCSPGAYSSKLTKRVVCSSSFRTDTIRNVPQSEKFAVERAYGMEAKAYGRTLEIDHIVSLELGGSNDIANLFPEPGSGHASYHAKDKLENRLHDMVCKGDITLRRAQRAIASDWVALYERVFGRKP